MKKVALFLMISLFLQGFFVSSAQAMEDIYSLELPYGGSVPYTPAYRVYNTDNKIMISSRVPVAGLQFETTGSWDLDNVLLPSGWTLRENNGRVLIYTMSESILLGPVNLFSYTGDLTITDTIAADRYGNRIMPPASTTIVPMQALSVDNLQAYQNFFENVPVLDYGLDLVTSTVLYADNISAGPGQADVEYSITMDNNSNNVVGTQFTLTDLPDWVSAVSAVSRVDGFDAYVNDHDGIAEVMVINLEGSSMPVGTNIPLVDLYLNVASLATLGQTSNINFSDIVVSDSNGMPLLGIGVDGSVSIGTRGDVNIDGSIDILDIVMTINFALDIDTPDSDQLWLADMNSDGGINVLDVVHIINLVVIPVPDQLTVSLATDTPSAGTVVSRAIRYPFTKINLTAGNQDVTIDYLTIERGGVAQDGSFSSVDILDADTWLPIESVSRTLNASHQATFTQNFVIPANSSKSLYLTGNMGWLPNYAGETPTLGLVDIGIVGATPMIGTLPIFGNPQILNATITIGTNTIRRGSYNPVTSTNASLGSLGYTFFGFQLQAGSTEDEVFDQISIYQEGTAQLGTDLTNFELFRDGTKVSDGVVNGNYIHFSNINDYISVGQTHQFQVKADIVGGVSRSVNLGVYRAVDARIIGQTYGYNILPTYSGEGSSYSSPVLSGNMFFISPGTLTVSRGDSVPAGNIVIGSNQDLGAFQFTVTGEPIQINQINITIVSSAAATIEDAINSIKLVDENDNTVAGPVDIMNNSTNALFMDHFVVPIGSHDYKVVANLASYGGWQNNDAIYIRLATPATQISAVGQTSGLNIIASPFASIDSNMQIIKTANLTVTRDTLPANGYLVAGTQDALLGSWTFDATESGEDIRITTLMFAASSTGANNLTVYEGTYANGIIHTPIVSGPSMGDGNTTTFAFDEPIIISKGTSQTIQLVGDIDNNVSVGSSAQFGLTDSSTILNTSVVAYGVSTANRARLNLIADDGAIFTYVSNGAVTVSTYNMPQNALVRAGGTGITFGYIKFDAQYEDLDLDQLRVYVADGGVSGTAIGNYQDVLAVYIYDGSTLLASNAIPSTGYYTFNFTNGTLTVPQDGSKTLTIKADLGAINQNFDNAPATPDADIKFGLGGIDGFQFTGNQSNAISSETYNGSTTSAMVLHKTIPTVAYSTSALPLGAVTGLSNGALDLFAFNVTADWGGDVLLYRSTFEITTGGGLDTNVNNCYLKDEFGNQISQNQYPISLENGKNYVTFVYDNPDISVGDSKEAISVRAGSSSTFTLNCNVSNAGSGDYLSVSLLGDTASSTPSFSLGTPEYNGQNIADAWSAMNQGNFVWSDNFKNRAISVSYPNATSYGQWYNGYLVSGLGQNTTGTAYTIGWSAVKKLPYTKFQVQPTTKYLDIVR